MTNNITPSVLNRPFEFRVWHIPTQTMHLVGLIDFESGRIIPLLSEEATLEELDKADQNPFSFGDCELMQFTGVLDENGVKIWEGDILAHRWEGEDDEGNQQDFEDHLEVFFANGTFGYQDQALTDEYNVKAGGSLSMPVIANKWEQPFLLETATVTI